MHHDKYIHDVFTTVDKMHGASLAGMMTPGGLFRFANIPGIQGREAITAFLDNFYQSIKAIKHDQLEDWSVEDTRFATGRVTYTRHDDSTLAVPFSVILRMKENLIDEYLIFVDASELYKPE